MITLTQIINIERIVHMSISRNICNIGAKILVECELVILNILLFATIRRYTTAMKNIILVSNEQKMENLWLSKKHFAHVFLAILFYTYIYFFFFGLCSFTHLVKHVCLRFEWMSSKSQSIGSWFDNYVNLCV